MHQTNKHLLPESNITEVQTDFDINPLLALRNPPTDQELISYEQNKYIGTPITETKEENVFRLIGGNPNGLKLNARGGELSEYMEQAKQMSADAVLLFEVNLDT